MNIRVESTATIKHGDMTIDEKYEPAMKIRSQKKADDYFEFLVQHTMTHWDYLTYEEAVENERRNLAYYSGYFNPKVQERVRKLFKTPMGR